MGTVVVFGNSLGPDVTTNLDSRTDLFKYHGPWGGTSHRSWYGHVKFSDFQMSAVPWFKQRHGHRYGPCEHPTPRPHYVPQWQAGHPCQWVPYCPRLFTYTQHKNLSASPFPFSTRLWAELRGTSVPSTQGNGVLKCPTSSGQQWSIFYFSWNSVSLIKFGGLVFGTEMLRTEMSPQRTFF